MRGQPGEKSIRMTLKTQEKWGEAHAYAFTKNERVAVGFQTIPLAYLLVAGKNAERSLDRSCAQESFC